MNDEHEPTAPYGVARADSHPFTVGVTDRLVDSMDANFSSRFSNDLTPGAGKLSSIDDWQARRVVGLVVAGRLSGWLEGLELVLPRDEVRAKPAASGARGDRALVMTKTALARTADWPTQPNKAVVVTGERDGRGPSEASTGYGAYLMKTRHVDELWAAVPRAAWSWTHPGGRPERSDT